MGEIVNLSTSSLEAAACLRPELSTWAQAEALKVHPEPCLLTQSLGGAFHYRMGEIIS